MQNSWVDEISIQHLIRRLKGKHFLLEVGTDGRILLKCIPKIQNLRM
jgi:hypothetical protein